MKIDIREILFWILLVVGVGLIVWNVFGDSPTEFFALVTVMLMVLMKVWGVSDRQIRLEGKFNNFNRSFKNLAEDFKTHAKHK